MTATAPRPTLPPPDLERSRRRRSSVRLVTLIVAGVVVAALLGIVGHSLIGVGIVLGTIVACLGAAFFRNDPGLIVPALIFSMWFEGLGSGVITLGRVLAAVVPLLVGMLVLTTRWRPQAFDPRAWLPVALLTLWGWAGNFYAIQTGGVGGHLYSFLTFLLGVSYALGIALFLKGPEQLEALLRQWLWLGVPIAVAGVAIHFTLGNRIFGFTGGPNTYAAYVQMLFPLVVVFARREVGRRRWIYWSMVPIYLAAVLASGSRGGLIGTAVVGVYIFVTMPGASIPRRLGLLVIGGLAGLGIFLLFGILDPERFSAGALSNSGGGTGRLDIWNAGLQVLRGHWVFGLGMGGFSVNAIKYIQQANNTKLQLLQSNEVISQGGTNTQNLFLQVALDMGVIGLVLYLGVLATTFKNLWDLRKTRWSDLSWAFSGSLIGGLAAGVFASQYNQKFVWVIIGASASVYYRHRLTARKGVRSREGLEHSPFTAGEVETDVAG